jgi:hypothetical protein
MDPYTTSVREQHLHSHDLFIFCKLPLELIFGRMAFRDGDPRLPLVLCANAEMKTFDVYHGECVDIINAGKLKVITMLISYSDVAKMIAEHPNEFEAIEESQISDDFDVVDDSMNSSKDELKRFLHDDPQQHAWWLESLRGDELDNTAVVNVYVVDTGVNAHNEFDANGHIRVHDAFNIDGKFARPSGSPDCNGHGTHVASLVAGKNTGLARKARVHSVKVFSKCHATGTTEMVTKGLSYIIEHVRYPAVVVMSLHFPNSSPLIQNLLRYMIDVKGLIIVAAAGNQTNPYAGYGNYACTGVPAGVPGVITIGAIDADFHRYYRGNYGPCVTLHAPGVNVWGASAKGVDKYEMRTGTSQAAPIVAGVVASFLSSYPGLDPSLAKQLLIDFGTESIIKDDTFPSRLTMVSISMFIYRFNFKRITFDEFPTSKHFVFQFPERNPMSYKDISSTPNRALAKKIAHHELIQLRDGFITIPPGFSGLVDIEIRPLYYEGFQSIEMSILTPSSWSSDNAVVSLDKTRIASHGESFHVILKPKPNHDDSFYMCFAAFSDLNLYSKFSILVFDLRS